MAEREPLPGPGGGEALVAGEPGAPGVVLVHDRHGLLPHVGGLADALAAEGLRAVAPDLYDGRTSVEADGAGRLMVALEAEPALGRLDAAAALAGPGPVGVVGFSMGGSLALRWALDARPAAAVAYYAALDAGWPGPMPCPVLLHLAEVDEWDPPDRPLEFAREMALAGTPVSLHVHVGTGHGFANADVPAYTRAAASSAWLDTVAHLRRAPAQPMRSST